MGKLRGKARWDVIVNPYTSNEHYYMVLGDPPEGATIAVGGPKSAYRTAQMLRGKPPSKEVKVDSGFQDITVTPEGKKITLHFTPDPKLETKGDITIGQGIPRISTRTRLPVSRAPRITPRMPRLR